MHVGFVHPLAKLCYGFYVVKTCCHKICLEANLSSIEAIYQQLFDIRPILINFWTVYFPLLYGLSSSLLWRQRVPVNSLVIEWFTFYVVIYGRVHEWCWKAFNSLPSQGGISAFKYSRYGNCLHVQLVPVYMKCRPTLCFCRGRQELLFLFIFMLCIKLLNKVTVHGETYRNLQYNMTFTLILQLWKFLYS